MRDGYFVEPVKLVLNSIVNELTHQHDAELHEVSWELELLLLDRRIPERDWRLSTAQALAHVVSIIQRRGKRAPSLEDLVAEMAL